MSPGQDEECPSFMAQSYVDGMELNDALWRESAGSYLLC